MIVKNAKNNLAILIKKDEKQAELIVRDLSDNFIKSLTITKLELIEDWEELKEYEKDSDVAVSFCNSVRTGAFFAEQSVYEKLMKIKDKI